MSNTPYATLEEAKAMSAMQSDAHDVAFQLALNAAGEAIEHLCQRRFVADAVASVREYSGTGVAWVYVDECIAVEQVEVRAPAGWTVIEAVGFAGDALRPSYRPPYAGVVRVDGGIFFTGDVGATVRVRARWGYAESVPPVVKMACIGQATRWLKRSQGSWADTLMAGDAGTMLYKQVLDPDIKMMLVSGRLVRPTV